MQSVEIDSEQLTPEMVEAAININKALMAIVIDLVKTGNRILGKPQETPIVFRIDQNIEAYYMAIESVQNPDTSELAFRVSIINKQEVAH